MYSRLLALLLGTALVSPATPTFLGCYVVTGFENPPRVCDWWNSGGKGGLYMIGALTPPGPIFTASTSLTVQLLDFGFRPLGPLTLTGATPVNVGDTQTADYPSRVSFSMMVNEGPPVFYLLNDAQVSSLVNLTAVNSIPAGLERQYAGEMLKFDFAAGGFLFRESPTMQSLGETSLSNHPSGLTAAASFFDVFFEISLDDGQTWIPANGPQHLEATPNIPEPASGALMLVGVAAMFLVRCHAR